MNKGITDVHKAVCLFAWHVNCCGSSNVATIRW